MKNIQYMILLSILLTGFSLKAQQDITTTSKEDTTFKIDYSLFLTDAELKSKPLYTSLVKAMNNYDKVYRLKIKSTGGFYGKITKVYTHIDTLENLQSFEVINEALKSLPSRFKKLHYLQKLYLSANLFQEIPMVVFAIKNIKLIDMNSNDITEISGKISDLKKLEYLYLNNNRNLEEIPVYEIAKLKNLKVLDLSNTKVPHKIIEILRKELPKTKIDY